MYIVGIDPGPVTGIVRLRQEPSGGPSVDALQVTRGLLDDVLAGLTWHKPAIAVERFVVGPRAGRSATAGAGADAREVVTLVADWAARNGLPFHARSAAEVKPWATDARLDAAGLLDLTKGMRHARDAARHALYAAVRDYGLPDPLSRRAHPGPVYTA